EHREWLKANFADDRGWQEFLAEGKPPLRRDSYPFSGQSPYGPVPLEPPIAMSPPLPPPPPLPAPSAPRAVVPDPAPGEPLEAPEAQIADSTPPEFRPLDASRPLASDATDKQCLPALLKLLAAGDVAARTGAASLLANTASSTASAAACATALADAANDPDE